MKTHSYKKIKKSRRLIITVRHPFNSVVSSALRYEEPLDPSSMVKNSDEYMQFGGNDLLKLQRSMIESRLLRYEDFTRNQQETVGGLAKFLRVRVTAEEVEKIVAEFSIDRVAARQSDMATFSEMHSLTQIHGKHISKFSGQTDYRKVLSEESIQALRSHVGVTAVARRFGYTV